MTREGTPVGRDGFCDCDDCVTRQPWRRTGERPALTLEQIQEATRRRARAIERKMQHAREVL